MHEHFSFKKISLFIANLNGGGAERVFISLARIFVQQGFEVEFIVGIRSGQLATEVNDFTLIDLKANSAASSVLPLASHLRKNPPDILLSAMPHVNLAAIIAAKLSFRKLKVVCSVHENAFYSLEHVSFYEKMLLRLLKIAYYFSDGLIAVSKGLLESQLRFYGRSIPRFRRMIYNPIIENISLVMPLRPIVAAPARGKFKIISAGRLSFEKDFSSLIRSFSLLSDVANISLTIFGEGPERANLEELVSKLKLEKNVFLPGFSNDLRSQFISSDLFIMSSIWEGFGNVLVEAMAAGCPVISTDCESGPKEILDNGNYGKLVPVGNVNEMRAAIEEARSGNVPVFDTKEAVQRFTFETIGLQYLSFFESCITKQPISII